MVDRSGIVTFRNSLAQDLYRRLGYIEDILGQPYENVRLVEQDGNSEECSGYSYVETTVSNLVLDIKHIQLNSAGAAFAVIIQDVTWRREQEQALILKSVAIKEIHHRVKNNLQTIASLLRLQTRRTDSEETRQVLGESMNRILPLPAPTSCWPRAVWTRSCWGGHPEHKEQYHAVFFQPQMLCHHYHGGRGLSGGLRHRHVGGHHHQRTASELPEVRLPGPLFREIRIVVEQGKLYSSIQVSDNGGGFDVANTEGNRLGLSIVQTLVKDKLRGNLEIESGPEGTCARFDFKIRSSERPT